MKPREIKVRMWSFTNKTMSVGICLKNMVYSFVEAGKLTIELDSMNERYIHVMQYTGAKDSRGKEIYESDLIKGHFQNEFGSFSEGIALVKWCSAHMGWEAKLKDDGEVQGHSIGIQCEVIGNIYENPNIKQS